jgi:hypothetical protein
MNPEAAEQREVPIEDAEVMPVGEPKKKRRRDRNQRNVKKRTQGMDGCRRSLTVARRGTSRRVKVTRQTKRNNTRMSRRATVARRKIDIVKSYITQEKCRPRRELVASRTRTAHRAGVVRCKENTIGKVRARDNVVRGTWKGWTPRWRQLICQEGTKETSNRYFKDQLRLGSKWTLWRGRPLPNEKRETARIGGTGNVEVPASPARMNVGRMKVTNTCETTDRRTPDHKSARGEHH